MNLIADFRGGFESLQEELHPSFLGIAVVLPVLTMESAATHRYLPVDASLLRLRRHDDHSSKLHLPRYDWSRRNCRVNITIHHLALYELASNAVKPLISHPFAYSEKHKLGRIIPTITSLLLTWFQLLRVSWSRRWVAGRERGEGCVEPHIPRRQLWLVWIVMTAIVHIQVHLTSCEQIKNVNQKLMREDRVVLNVSRLH